MAIDRDTRSHSFSLLGQKAATAVRQDLDQSCVIAPRYDLSDTLVWRWVAVGSDTYEFSCVH